MSEAPSSQGYTSLTPQATTHNHGGSRTNIDTGVCSAAANRSITGRGGHLPRFAAEPWTVHALRRGDPRLHFAYTANRIIADTRPRVAVTGWCLPRATASSPTWQLDSELNEGEECDDGAANGAGQACLANCKAACNPALGSDAGVAADGKGGTQGAGGAGGINNGWPMQGKNGALGLGGDGSLLLHSGGGGGGGSVDGSAGGGSSFFGGVANGSTQIGLKTGDGQVILSY